MAQFSDFVRWDFTECCCEHLELDDTERVHVYLSVALIYSPNNLYLGKRVICKYIGKR
jgi:hypothetical protein